jgi:hypothetical protein
MGLFGWLFSSGGPGDVVEARSEGNSTLYHTIERQARKVIEEKQFAKNPAGAILTLADDRGFFSDVYKIFCGTMYSWLRDMDPRSFVLSVASTALLGGIYVYFSAKVESQPLYVNYASVKSHFFEDGPLPCVTRFLETMDTQKTPEEISDMLDTVVKAALTENLESYCGRRDVLAIAKSLYNMGITMGTYFI